MRSRKSSVSRHLFAKVNNQKLYPPLDFLSPKRIDIAAKTVFARAYIEGNKSSWPEKVYKEHIRAFNNFYEKDPLKTSYRDFKESFIQTINSVRDEDGWKSKAPILRDKNYLINGAHRVAASIVVDDLVNTRVPEEIYKGVYNYDFFRRSKQGNPGIDEKVLDYITIEYVSLKKSNVFAAIIFPTAEGYRKEAYEHLLGLGEIVNMKTFKCNEFVGKEVIKQLYFNSKNDEWNYGLDFDSAAYKASLCFDGTSDLEVYIIEANLDETTRVEEKRYLRSLWNKDKHSIHITDTIEEVNRVARMFFNENSRRFMKIQRTKEFESEKIYNLFNDYTQKLPKDIIERERYAIEGSAVLDLMNIRTGRDIDYITTNVNDSITGDDIEKHQESENKYHTTNIDDIITNPDFYFYYKGYKFIDILELYKYKQKRYSDYNDTKDLHDTKRIANFLRRNKQYGNKMTESLKPVTEEPLFSIIIPLYNKEKYIATCLRSVQDQTEDSWECIIVDDGSTDNSISIATIFAENDHRFKVVKQENSGPSVARNRGIHEASGKMIHFLDADDYYPAVTTLRTIADIYKKESPLAIAGSIGVVRVNGGEADFNIEINCKKNMYMTFFDLQDDYFFTRFFFNRKFIVDSGILFPTYTRVGEDPVFLVRVLSAIDKFYATSTPVYIYNTVGSQNSRFNEYPVNDLVGYIRAQLEVLDICKERKYTALIKKIINRIDDEMIVAYAKNADDSRELREYLERLNLYTYSGMYYDKVKRRMHYEQQIDKLGNTVKIQNAELDMLRNPSVKLATRKLAGSIKRKAKKRYRQMKDAKK